MTSCDNQKKDTESELDEISVWYRDNLIKLLGWGVTLFIIIVGWVISTEQDFITFSKKYKVTEDSVRIMRLEGNLSKNEASLLIERLKDLTIQGKKNFSSILCDVIKGISEKKKNDILNNTLCNEAAIDRAKGFVFFSLVFWISWFVLVNCLRKKLRDHPTIPSEIAVRRYSRGMLILLVILGYFVLD
ncbi:MAG: hypothetical protein ACL93V_06095 [Candidatus Electrothrix sp. YB6]